MNEKLRKILGIIIGLTFYMFIVTFMTYALYSWRSETTAVSLTIEDANCELSPETLEVNVEGLGPVLDYNSSENITNNNVVYADFTAINDSSITSTITITLNIENITDNLKTDTFKYILLKKDTSNKYSTIVSEGNFTNSIIGNNTIIENYSVSSQTEDNFRFIVYIDGTKYNDSNIMNGSMTSNLNLSINCNSQTTSLLSTYIQDLYSNATLTSVTTAGGEAITQASSVGLMQDSFGNIRYYGASPNNYVTFNGEEAGWRIISVSDVEDESGNTEKRVRLIRNESIGTYSYDNKPSGTGTSTSSYGSNDWTDARLMMLLNPDYETPSSLYAYEGSLYWNSKSGTCYSGSSEGTTSCDFTSTGLTDEGKSMIGQAKYYLGGNSTVDELYADDYYNFERGTTVYSGHATEWTGYVGIMYPSDYAYAADLSLCTQDGYNYSSDTTNCTGTDWLFKLMYQWTIAPGSSDAYRAFDVRAPGYVHYSNVYYAEDVRPVVVLESEVTIVSGEGTSDNPYQITIS